jgi:hypothetical protein
MKLINIYLKICHQKLKYLLNYFFLYLKGDEYYSTIYFSIGEQKIYKIIQ